MTLDTKADNQIYNLEGDKDVTIKELADLVSSNIENVKVEYIVDKTRAGELITDSIEISNQKMDSKNKEKEIHQSYKNEIVKKSNSSLKKNI